METPETGVCIRAFNALAARCSSGSCSGAASPHAASPCVEARLAGFFAAIGRHLGPTTATPALAAAAAAALAAGQAPEPHPDSDLGKIARQMATLLYVCVCEATNMLLAAGAAVAVPGGLRAVIWCCAAALEACDGSPLGMTWVLGLFNSLSKVCEMRAVKPR